MFRSSASDPCGSSDEQANIASHTTFIGSLIAPTIETFCFTALTVLIAMAFIGSTSASATALCKTDEEPCAAANLVMSAHEVSVGNAKVLTSIGTTECNVLFATTKVGGPANPQKLQGNFSYSNCTLGGSGCAFTEENGPGELLVSKEGHETAKITGERLTHLTCGSLINCSYTGTGLAGTFKGALLAVQANGEVTISGQELTKEAGSGYICPKTSKLDINTTPLTPIYIASVGVQPPTTNTAAATGTKAHETTLHGSVNPNGADTTYQFEYGTTTSYGSKAPASPKAIGSGTGSIEAVEAITGLQSGTSYHYRLVASNGAGTTMGGDNAFTTPSAPVVTAEAATSLSASEATLNATVNPKGAATTYQFEWGPTTAYGNKVPASPEGIGSSESTVAVSKQIGSLNEGATYHYRAVAENEAGRTYGADQTLTMPYLPEATTETATFVEANEATFEGSVDPNGESTTYQFQYGTSPSYGSTVPSAPEEAGAGTAAADASEPVAHLTPETTYHYRIIARSSAGTVVGEDKTLTTGQAVMNPAEEAAHEQEELAFTGATTGEPPSDFVNMMWTGEFTQMARANIMNVIKESGAKMIRLPIKMENWVGDWSLMDKIFRQANARGITILPGLGGGGPWPTTEGSGDWNKWLTFAQEAVEHYGPGGSFWATVEGAHHVPRVWEIWNEPNIARNAPPGPIDPANFGKFFAAMSQRVKETANHQGSSVEVLLAGLLKVGAASCEGECHVPVREFIEKMGYEASYDAISLHPYAFRIGDPSHAPGGYPDPDRTPGEAAPWEIERLVEKIHSNIQEARDALKAKGEGYKEVWITELGFPVENPSPERAARVKFPPVSEKTQKKLLESSFDMIKADRKELKIHNVFYFNLQDWYDLSDPVHKTWDYRSGLRKYNGRFRESWKGFVHEAHGDPNVPRPAKASQAVPQAFPRRAVLTGRVDPEGLSTNYIFELGPGVSGGYTYRSPEWKEAGFEEAEVEVSEEVQGLTPRTKYHYQLVVENENGEVGKTGPQVFETAGPTETTGSVKQTLNGEPGWVSVGGWVKEGGGGVGIDNVYVNVNFQREIAPELFEPVPELSQHVVVHNGYYEVDNVPIGRGHWQTRTVFPPQYHYESASDESASGYHEFRIKNGYQLVDKNSGKCLEVTENSRANGAALHRWECGDPANRFDQVWTLVPQGEAYYQLVSRTSNYCADVINVDPNPGAGVQQWECLGPNHANQIWQGIPVEKVGENEYVHFVAKHSGLCLEIQNGGTGNGAVAVQNTCGSGASQKWTFLSVESNQVPLEAHITVDEVLYGHPGYVTFHGNIDAGGYNMSNKWVNVNFQRLEGGEYRTVSGETLHPTLNANGYYSYSYWGIGAGDWRTRVVYPGEGPLAEDASEYHYFHVGDGYRFQFRHSGRCLSTSGGGTANGTQILQWDCSSSPNPNDGQVYSIVPVNPIGSSEFTIRPDSNTNMCLDVTGVSTANGAYLQLYQCLGESQANQIWHIVPLAGQTEWFASIARHSGKCMDVAGANTANGARLLQWECTWTGNQQWKWQKIG